MLLRITLLKVRAKLQKKYLNNHFSYYREITPNDTQLKLRLEMADSKQAWENTQVNLTKQAIETAVIDYRVVENAAAAIQKRNKMYIHHDKPPKTCYMCGVEPFAHLTPCDCCNHHFCISCIDKFDELRHVLIERKLIAKDEKLGHIKTIAAKLGNEVFCLCNTSLRCNIETESGKPNHYTSEEQKVYTMFELMNYRGQLGKNNTDSDDKPDEHDKVILNTAPAKKSEIKEGLGL